MNTDAFYQVTIETSATTKHIKYFEDWNSTLTYIEKLPTKKFTVKALSFEPNFVIVRTLKRHEP